MKTKSKSFKLGSIADEAALCRKAFAKVKVGAFTLHCHHEVLGETLTEDAEARISYILSTKPEHEQALRLRLFRPVLSIQLKKHKKADADRQKAYADWQKADADLAALVHDKVCYSNCPWNGKTIFPKGSK